MALVVLVSFISQFLINNVSAEEPETLEVVYFYSEKCLSCKQNKDFISELEQRNDISFHKYNVDDMDCTAMQLAYAEHAGISTEFSVQIPAIYFADDYYSLSPTNHIEVREKRDSTNTDTA